MHGILVDENAASVEGAIVNLFISDTAADSVPCLTDTTDTAGLYVFDTTDLALLTVYNIEASYNDDELVAFIDGITYDTISFDVGTDTLKAPGAIAGTVLLEDTAQAGVRCYVPGTSYFATSNDTGGFVISNIPEGMYDLLYREDDYVPASRTNVNVISGMVTTVPAETLILDPSIAPPAPDGLSAEYDSSTGLVTLAWNRVKVSDLAGYEVFTDTGAGPYKITKTLHADTLYHDTVFIYSNDSTPDTLFYQVRAVDSSANPSLYCNPVSVLVYPRDTTAHNVWATLDSMKYARRFFAAVPCNNRIYALGGEKTDLTTGMRQVLDIVEEYDPSSNTWAQKAAMPTARAQCAAVAFEGRIYVIGGRGYPSDPLVIERYDPSADLWDTAGTLSSVRNACAAAAIGKYIYITGGRIGFDLLSPAITRFDPSNGQPSVVADLALPRHAHQAVVLDNMLYVFGGEGGSQRSAGWQLLNSVEIFNPSAGTVARGDNFTTARINFAAVGIGSKAYIIGGFGGNSYTLQKSIEEYDAGTRTWTAISALSSARQGLAACVYSGKIFIMGGDAKGYPLPNMGQSNGAETYRP
jgi:N-acetylneuraminic acid mutarotase